MEKHTLLLKRDCRVKGSVKYAGEIIDTDAETADLLLVSGRVEEAIIYRYIKGGLKCARVVKAGAFALPKSVDEYVNAEPGGDTKAADKMVAEMNDRAVEIAERAKVIKASRAKRHNARTDNTIEALKAKIAELEKEKQGGGSGDNPQTIDELENAIADKKWNGKKANKTQIAKWETALADLKAAASSQV